MTTTPSTADRSWHRTWDALADPTLPLREPDAGPWLVIPDLFGTECVPAGGVLNGEAIIRSYAVMMSAYWHWFILPTAYPARMGPWIAEAEPKVTADAVDILDWGPPLDRPAASYIREGKEVPWNGAAQAFCQGCETGFPWPLDNVLPAVYLRTQSDAHRLIPNLLRVPAGPRGRLLILEPIEWFNVANLGYWRCSSCGRTGKEDDLVGFGRCNGCGHELDPEDDLPFEWLIIPSSPQLESRDACDRWLVETREACRDAGVPLWCGTPIGGEAVREWPEGWGDEHPRRHG